MNYDKLDNDELLRLSVDAINGSRDAESIVMLKTLLERDPRNSHAQYLMAAQHAQLGMYDRAETEFRALMALGGELPAARFQFSQLLLLKGDGDEATQVLAPLVGRDDAMGAYARALTAAARDDVPTAVAELEAGLQLPQEIPVLADDMQRLLGQFRNALVASGAAPAQASSAPLFLTGYAREG